MIKPKEQNVISYSRRGSPLNIGLGSVIFFLFLFIPSSVKAQLRLVPLQPKAISTPAVKDKNYNARTKETLLTLPFWDDFSFTPVNDSTDTTSNFPLDSIWMESWDVNVNGGIGINPPTINVATFDGLDSVGNSYSDQTLANGFRDDLTSQPIDLSLVEVDQRSTVFFSFFYQWGGNGEPPDPKDELRVEFKNDQDTWETVVTILPKESFAIDVFYDTIIQLQGDRFFHNDFQFRFRNYGRLSGPYDTWNIDYVYLNKGRNLNDNFFPDAAIASTIGPIFGDYHSIPILHFKKNPQVTPAEVDVLNLRSYLASYSYNAYGSFTNYVGDDTLIHQEILVKGELISSGASGGLLNPFERKRIILSNPPDPANTSQFDPAADSIDIDLQFKLVTNDVVDTLGNRAPDYLPIYDSIDFRKNDSVTAQYSLRDYYAYDDGTAEYAVILNNPGNRVAYRFDMLTDEPDLLTGLDVYSPAYGLANSTTADFYIYADSSGYPGDLIASIPSRTIQRNGNNKFQTLPLEGIPVIGSFHIGWRASTGGVFRVGVDFNNNTGDKIFVNANGKWEPNTDIQGSLMLRPRLGSDSLVTGIEETEHEFLAYPNPSQGQFYINNNVDGVEIISITGQRIPSTYITEDNKTTITLPQAVPGLYILKTRKFNKAYTQKILVR